VDVTTSYPRPIVVLAGPHTHGSLVAAMIGQNPAAYGILETNLSLFDTLDVQVRELTGLRGTQLHGMIRVLAQLLSGEQTHASTEMAWRWVFNHMHWPTGWVRDFILGRIAPLRTVERNTSALFDKDALERLIAQYQGADFVHVTRHPRAHGQAIMADGGAVATLLGSYDDSVDPAVLDPQVLWTRTERSIDKCLQDVPEARIHRVHVERLLTAPRRVMRNLAKSLKLPHGKDAINLMMHPELSEYARPGPMGAHLGDFPEFMGDPTLPEPDDEMSLEGALGWREDNAMFLPDTLRLARARGYT